MTFRRRKVQVPVPGAGCQVPVPVQKVPGALRLRVLRARIGGLFGWSARTDGALQDPDANYKCLVIRGTRVSTLALQRSVESLDREVVSSMQSLAYIVDRTLLRERLTASVAGFFGALAVVLAGIGVYGLMAYTVGQRRREAGIRLALGAERREVTTGVMRSALRITVVGTVVGLAAGLASVQVTSSLLYGLTPRDPLTFAVAPALMVTVALLASLLPAIRLGRTDPLIALRAD